jgi:hypothetical protein
MGVSLSNTIAPNNPIIYAGTAGMLVRVISNPSIKLILSNNHVLGAGGPNLCPNNAPVGTWALQPGTLDIGSDPGNDVDYIAGVGGFYIPIDFTPGASNVVDAALALTVPALASRTIHDIGEPNPAFMLATAGQTVKKSGRTTGVTTGTVQSVNSTVNVNYGTGCGTARFVAQTIVTPGTFSDPGDSGSAILDSATLTPVGLLFAGSATRTIANPIWGVYLSMGVFVDSDDAPTSFAELAQTVSTQVDARTRQIMTVQRQAEPAIFAVPGVIGMGIGRTADGSGPAIIVYSTNVATAVASRIPTQLSGVPVRLMLTDEFRAY